MTFLLDGRLSLTTPEGVRLLMTPAGPAIRAYAWGIDFVIWLVGTGLLSWLLMAVLGNSGLGGGVFLLLLFLGYWAYPVLCEVHLGGRTFGKRFAGLMVVRSDGLPVGWRDSILRNLLLVADFLPCMYASGLLCMLSDARFRRLGDLVAGTLVVYREPPPARRALPDTLPLPLPFPLTPEQQRALADLFAREARLAPDRMEELGDIAEPLTGRLGADSIARLRGMAAGLAR
jgi:uncharacterized RDD family membrane protein YckC